MPVDKNPPSFQERAKEILAVSWKRVQEDFAKNEAVRFVEDEMLFSAIKASINHKQVSYRFVLPIQVLGKLANGAFDCRNLQAGKKNADPRAWDARSLGSGVVAPWNREQQNVLGSSGDPYVSNPLRQPRMLPSASGLKDKAGWLVLLNVLDEIEERNSEKLTTDIFLQVLVEIIIRQKELTFTYPVPPRVSVKTALALTNSFLLKKSGGDRALALSAALFSVFGKAFGLFTKTTRGAINAPDEQSGTAGDIECLDVSNKIIFIVEVKDRKLSLSDLEDTLRKSRERSIQEIFVIAHNKEESEREAIDAKIESAYSSGQSTYILSFEQLAETVLSMGGESIRRDFLSEVGHQLDEFNTQPEHRLAWRKLLEQI
jgi:hypothetical protein